VHDTLGHYLTIINVQLEVVTKLIDTNPTHAKEAATKAKQLASEGLGEVRRSIAALRPSPLEDKPLPEAIRTLIETSRDTGLLITFEQLGTTHPLSPDMETVLYRAAQEALTNIRKHAHASAVGVRLAYETGAVDLRIRDNGVGRHNEEDNVGLSALRERVTALHGTVLAENHLEGGFVLDITLPVRHA
jgi:signal transduction histidine kinase